MTITIKKLDNRMLSGPVSDYITSQGFRSAEYFRKLLEEQDKGFRVALIAFTGNSIIGHVTVKWLSEYPRFRERDIPEINDLWVVAEYRRQYVATALVDEAERIIFERSSLAGIGVGLYADYGPAQQMYVLRGYIPDGNGVYCGKQPARPGSNVLVDDDLVLYFIKHRQEK